MARRGSVPTHGLGTPSTGGRSTSASMPGTMPTGTGGTGLTTALVRAGAAVRLAQTPSTAVASSRRGAREVGRRLGRRAGHGRGGDPAGAGDARDVRRRGLAPGAELEQHAPRRRRPSTSCVDEQLGPGLGAAGEPVDDGVVGAAGGPLASSTARSPATAVTCPRAALLAGWCRTRRHQRGRTPRRGPAKRRLLAGEHPAVAVGVVVGARTVHRRPGTCSDTWAAVSRMSSGTAPAARGLVRGLGRRRRGRPRGSRASVGRTPVASVTREPVTTSAATATRDADDGVGTPPGGVRPGGGSRGAASVVSRSARAAARTAARMLGGRDLAVHRELRRRGLQLPLGLGAGEADLAGQVAPC